MGLRYHPKVGSLVLADYSQGFVVPEMVKLRLAVVISPVISARQGLCTIVPLSTTAPERQMPYHYLLRIPFSLPRRWSKKEVWVKGDMVNAVGWHRLSLLSLGKDAGGKRQYQTSVVAEMDLRKIRQCILHGLGMSVLTKNLSLDIDKS